MGSGTPILLFLSSLLKMPRPLTDALFQPAASVVADWHWSFAFLGGCQDPRCSGLPGRGSAGPFWGHSSSLQGGAPPCLQRLSTGKTQPPCCVLSFTKWTSKLSPSPSQSPSLSLCLPVSVSPSPSVTHMLTRNPTHPA